MQEYSIMFEQERIIFQSIVLSYTVQQHSNRIFEVTPNKLTLDKNP